MNSITVTSLYNVVKVLGHSHILVMTAALFLMSFVPKYQNLL